MPSLPTVTQTWRYRVNIQCAEASDQAHRQQLLFELVRSWLWLGTGWTDSAGASATMTDPPWAVVTSSDAVAYDNTNRWAALADLVWAADGVAHSHIQLVHANYFGTADPLYVLIDCSQGAGHRNATLGIYIARTEFGASEDGSILTRPTATDEIEVKPTGGSMSTAAWQGGDGSTEDDRTGRLHFMMSSDGRFVRAFICRNGVCQSMWDLNYDSTYDDASEWSHPVAMAVISADADPDQETLYYTSSLGTETFARYHSYDSINVEAEFGLQMEMSVLGSTHVTEDAAITMGGMSAVHPIRLSCTAPAAGAGAMTVMDAWWGRTALAGQQFPSDGTRQFTQFGIIVVQWNRSTVQLA